ncbi:DUF1611 domain-containing protein [Plantactinospora sp. B6F1]|uniref:DUF1611 domain-containing protein n=1 Tax=Plantactinospora sp. B6F1 TaxID=3158971 RepID=UPI0032D93B89
MNRAPAAVATFGRLVELDAKTGHGILRFCDNIVAVVDDRYAGRRLTDLLPYAGRNLPIVPTVAEAYQIGARELVIGAAPPGGEATSHMVSVIADAAKRDMWIVSGLHTRLTEHPELTGSAHRIVELRHRQVPELVATGAAAKLETTVLLTVGSDCAAGKMTTALELWRGLRTRGAAASFVATGQTAMYIAGDGAAVDAVKSDFAAGVTESMVLEAARGGARYILVEGQGSILHPAYSGVSLALLHGAAPNLLVFCHDLERSRMAYFDRRIADVADEIDLLERLSSHQRRAVVVGVVAMAGGMTPDQAARRRADLAARLGRPVVMPAPSGYEELVDLIAEF